MRIDIKEEIWGSKSSRLKNKRILFLITGSVAMYKVVDMIRDLIREGAEVETMISPSAQKMMNTTIFEWASGNPVVTNITGKIEHVLFAGKHTQTVDLIIVAPLTANTLGKMVNGIADTNVSLTLMTAIGNNIPILLIPGMHAPMFDNPTVQKNIEIISKNKNITWLEPQLIESKAKIPETYIVTQRTIRLLSLQLLRNQKILVTAGPNREFIDPIRFISNPSSGKMGFAFALEAWYLGAEIYFVVGPNQLQIPSEFHIYSVTSVNEMADKVKQILLNNSLTYAVFSAAVADYKPKYIASEKIRSGQNQLVIELEPTIKILKLVKSLKADHFPNLKVIAFKAEYAKTNNELQSAAKQFLDDGRADLVIANEVGPDDKGFEVDNTKVLLFSSSPNPKVIPASKGFVAYYVWQSILNIPMSDL